MANVQLYVLMAPAILAVFGVFFGSWTTNKRLDDFRADMKDMRAEMKDIRTEMKDLRLEIKEGFARVDRRFEQAELTLQAVRQGLADTKATLRGHEEAIGTLKERVK